MQVSRVVCHTFGMRSTATCFLHCYTSHPSDLVGWHSLVSRAGSVLLKAFTASYNNFKERFFKVFMEPAGMAHFFDAADQLRFPLSWTRNPTKIKDWPRSVNSSARERDIFFLFDSLPRKLSFRPLMSLYTESEREATFEGMFDTFRPLVLYFGLLTNTLFFVAAIAKREVSQVVDMLKEFKDCLKEKKGCSGTGPPPADFRVGSS